MNVVQCSENFMHVSEVSIIQTETQCKPELHFSETKHTIKNVSLGHQTSFNVTNQGK